MNSGMLAKTCGNPNNAFNNLINFYSLLNQEINIFLQMVLKQ